MKLLRCLLLLLIFPMRLLAQQADLPGLLGPRSFPSLPEGYPSYSGLERLARMEKFQADLCNEELLRRPEVLLERYQVFVTLFDGDDPSTERDNLLLDAARSRIAALGALEGTDSVDFGRLWEASLCQWSSDSEPTSASKVTAEERGRATFLLSRAYEHMNRKEASSAAQNLTDAQLAGEGDARLLFQVAMAWGHLARRCAPDVCYNYRIQVDENTVEFYWRQSLRSLAEVRRLRPSYAPAFYQAGLIHMRLGEKPEAGTCFRRALELGLKEPQARQAAQYLRACGG